MTNRTRRALTILAYPLVAAAFPAIALVIGVRAMAAREHPAVVQIESADVAAVPRPTIDLARPTVVVLLGADVTEITDALGPFEMFARAARYNVVTAAPERRATMLTGGLRILPHYSLAELDSVIPAGPAVVVVPNIPNADQPVNAPLIEWIRTRAQTGALVHSWCKGAMALAETGLLDGKQATAHWGDIRALEKRYPSVTWVRGVRWVEHGQFVMSAGITSGIDASLRVLIRLAGDTVAQRVAREIRYPNYRFALDPTVRQYRVEPSDLILFANAAFRTERPRLAVGLYDGVGELDLSTIFDAHVHTMTVRAETLAENRDVVITKHGLTIFPSRSAAGDEIADVDRVIIPGVDARLGARRLVAALRLHAPTLEAAFPHAAAPDRFGLEPIIEDLAATADRPTARFALKRMEFRSDAIRYAGPAIPWGPLTTFIALALAGLTLAFGVRRRRQHAIPGSSRAAE